MKRMLALLSAVIAAGCSGGANKQETDSIKKQLDQLYRDRDEESRKMVAFYSELETRHKDLLKRVEQLEGQVSILRADVDRLEKTVKTMGGTPSNGGAENRNPNVNPMTRVGEILLDMKSGKASTDEAAAQLIPYAKEAAPLMIEELKRSIAEIKYAVQLEKCLSKLPMKDLQNPLTRALDDKVLQHSVARVIREARDFELSKVLESYTSTSDEDFKLLIGAALVDCKNPAGLAPLIQSLRSTDYSTKTIAVNSLRIINKGQDYGFRASSSLQDNADAIQKWEKWLDENRDKIFEKK